MGCGEFLVKVILFVTNLIFALAGLSLLGLGIAAQLQLKVIVDFTEDNFQLAPISSMVIGSTVFIIAFLGCCGALRESNCMLVTYSILMLILMVAKLTLAVMIFSKLNEMVAEVPHWLEKAFNTSPEGFREIESAFSCCGTVGPVVYNGTLPESCCATAPCTLTNAFPGCNSTVASFVDTFGLAIGVFAIVVVAIELVAVVFGLCLANHVRNKGRRTRY